MDQFKNVSELGRDQSEDFLVKNILLSSLPFKLSPSDDNMHTQCVMTDSLWSLGIVSQQQTESM